MPGLAALFDRMTDHSIVRRFGAAQAQLFFDGIVSRLPHDALKAQVTVKRSYEAMQSAEVYWTRLSVEDISVWGKYRTPPRSLFGRLGDRLSMGLAFFTLYSPEAAVVVPMHCNWYTGRTGSSTFRWAR